MSISSEKQVGVYFSRNAKVTQAQQVRITYPLPSRRFSTRAALHDQASFPSRPPACVD